MEEKLRPLGNKLKKRNLIFLMMMLLVLTGCSAISSGYITKKVYEPPYSYTTMQCVVFGKYGCTSYMPITHTNPEHWRLDLKNRDKTGWVFVSKETFDSVKVGDIYNDEDK